jgi:hypothetical protein
MTSSAVVLTVIRYLGRIAAFLAAGVVALTWRLVDQAGHAGSVDPVAVGAVGAVCTLLGTTLGAFGALLVSTKTGPTNEELQALADLPPAEPIPVTGVDGGPVETVDTTEAVPKKK